MLNKKMLLSLGVAIVFSGCSAEEVDVDRDFRIKANAVLSPVERTVLNFKVDGKQGIEECFVLTAEQFEMFKTLIEYAVARPRIVSEENNPGNPYYDFTGKVGLSLSEHFCFVKDASFFDKLMMFVKTMDYTLFLKPIVVRTSSNADAAIKTSVKVNPCAVANVKSRIYPCVPVTSAIGNLPGIYLRVDGPTGKKGSLVGFSYRAEKNGDVADYLFGKLYVKEDH